MPSETDINLAIERKLALQHVYFNPSILEDHTFKQKSTIIPHLAVPPYLVDFGYVVFNNVVHYNTYLINYGPTNTTVRLRRMPESKSKKMIAQGKCFYYILVYIFCYQNTKNL